MRSVKAVIGDATKIHQQNRTYDRILVDVPCSGLGTIGRRADTRWRKSEHQIKDIVKLQSDILYSASQALKSGGRLVYSTCTLTPEENEKVIERFLDENIEFKLISVEEVLPNFTGKYLKLWPHLTGTDGFFAACLCKEENK